ncbi:SRPBCC family protein [Pseudemcibacter aquimaris]|uniref:SRPBCC family protein n=1 Tax=Pseudemcibacter aquimaris TaxID=2857064 RepID=UPI002011EE71|nr:SRPBCC family protein [Pseudemcibacter aquimaris]MCC3861232.1 SRPBCC family protein [Pseudemcibacter aquimaris]WDU58007.1 SRPBCC family protein [Pseudemcibacter aquimaris]
MSLNLDPVAKAELRIRKPVDVVFEAFVNPDQITRFWFDKSTGPLALGANVEWCWTMYGFCVPVRVTEFIDGEKIHMTWGDGDDLSRLEWTFAGRDDGTTLVTMINKGFKGTDDEKMAKALDSNGGFHLVVAAAKAYLEHGIKLNVVEDKF